MGLKTRLAGAGIGLFVAAAGLGLAVLWLLGRLRDYNPILRAGCESKPQPDPTWPPPLIILAALTFFAAGAGLSVLQQRRGRRPVEPPRWTRLLVQGVLAAFLALVAGLLLYETLALAPGSRLAPITYYVRCAQSAAPLWTLAGAAAASGLAGHWLWYLRRS